MIKRFLIFCILTLISHSNDVIMTINPSSTDVHETTNYAIFINRTKSITGATITASSIGNPIIVKLVF